MLVLLGLWALWEGYRWLWMETGWSRPFAATRRRCLYEGTEVTGSPEIVLLRGTVLVENGELVVEPGVGQFVERAASAKSCCPPQHADK